MEVQVWYSVPVACHVDTDTGAVTRVVVLDEMVKRDTALPSSRPDSFGRIPMSNSWQRYIDNGTRLVELHSDLHDFRGDPGQSGIDFYTAAKDQIGDILHAVREHEGEEDFDPDALLSAALRGYHGDYEERPGETCRDCGRPRELWTDPADTDADRCPQCVRDSLALACPECGATVWDRPSGSKLAKCWNSEDHASRAPRAFDTMSDEEESAS